MYKLKLIHSFIINIILIIFIIWLIYYYNFSNLQKQEYLIDQKYSFINPILEYDNKITYYNTKDVENKLQNFVNENSSKYSNISYYFRALNNWSTFWYNENLYYSPASLLKIPIALTYFREKENWDINIDNKQIYVDKINFEIQERDFWKDLVKVWNTYTIYDLIKNMLAYSDNTAAMLLLYNIWEERIIKTYNDMWLNLEKNNNDFFSRVTVKQYSSFFRILYNSSYLNRYDSNIVLDILSNSSFNEWLKKLLPKNIVISSKYWERFFTETWEKQLHDCWIIYLPNNPYILCVMTKWKNFDELKYLIQNISKIVYDDFLSKIN